MLHYTRHIYEIYETTTTEATNMETATIETTKLIWLKASFQY